MYDWKAWRRPQQNPQWEDGWYIWLLMTGRGYGKTRTGAEAVNEAVWERGVKRIVIMGRTEADTIRIMVKGASGILHVGPPERRPVFKKDEMEVHWPNGAVALVVSAESPDAVRGPEFELAWVDELASFSGLTDELNSPWTNLLMSVRSGDDPRIIVTSTPRRLQVLRDLEKAKTTRVTYGSTYDNIDNLPKSYIDTVIKPREGTRLAEQEIHGKILPDEEGALFTTGDIEKGRVKADMKLWRKMNRLVVAIDPAASVTDTSDQTGICVAGEREGEAYIFSSDGLKLSPNEWAGRGLKLYDMFEASQVIAEANNGGDMVKTVITNLRPTAPVMIIKATRGKALRAEPVSLMYQNGRVHHVGEFPSLEADMVRFPDECEFDDEIDAMVYAVTNLLIRRPIGYSSRSTRE